MIKILNNNYYNFFKPQVNKPKLSEKINKIFWVAIGTWSSYSLIDAGLANFLGLETLIHGTGPLGYFGISLNGANVKYGGGKNGSSSALNVDQFITNSKNHFYVFKDSENFNFTKFITVKCYAMFSGSTTFDSQDSTFFNKIIKKIIGATLGLFTPNLKFRFKPEDILDCKSSCRFKNDPDDYAQRAYRTSQNISNMHLGIMGSISQGINSKTFSRIIANPKKSFLGFLMIATGTLVAKATYRYYKDPIIKEENSYLKNLKIKIINLIYKPEKISCLQNLEIKIVDSIKKYSSPKAAFIIVLLNTI
jgi:hypothetical protein